MKVYKVYTTNGNCVLIDTTDDPIEDIRARQKRKFGDTYLKTEDYHAGEKRIRRAS